MPVSILRIGSSVSRYSWPLKRLDVVAKAPVLYRTCLRKKVVQETALRYDDDRLDKVLPYSMTSLEWRKYPGEALPS